MRVSRNSTEEASGFGDVLSFFSWMFDDVVGGWRSLSATHGN
jgi:hypothetical protein